MVSVVFGGFCARTDAVVQKSYLGWVPIFNHTTRSANTITIVLYFLYYELALHLASINVYEAAINYMMDGKK